MRAELMMDAEDRAVFEELLVDAYHNVLSDEEGDFVAGFEGEAINRFWEPTVREWARLREIAAR